MWKNAILATFFWIIFVLNLYFWNNPSKKEIDLSELHGKYDLFLLLHVLLTVGSGLFATIFTIFFFKSIL